MYLCKKYKLKQSSFKKEFESMLYSDNMVVYIDVDNYKKVRFIYLYLVSKLRKINLNK